MSDEGTPTQDQNNQQLEIRRQVEATMAAEISAVEESQINATSKVSYKIRTVTRYVLSKCYYETNSRGLDSGGCELIGEFETEAAANRVRDALTKSTDR